MGKQGILLSSSRGLAAGCSLLLLPGLSHAFSLTPQDCLEMQAQPMLVDIKLNGQSKAHGLSGKLVCMLPDQQVLITYEGLKQLGAVNLKLLPHKQYQQKSLIQFPLGKKPGYTLNNLTQELMLNLPIANLPKGSLDAGGDSYGKVRLDETPGAYLNYNLTGTSGSDQDSTTNLYATLGQFGGLPGLRSSSFAYNHTAEDSELIRYDTSWRLDDASSLITREFGDTTTVAPTWGGMRALPDTKSIKTMI